MKDLDWYLSKFTNAPAITLVGPLANHDPEEEEPLIYVDGGSLLQKSKCKGFSVGDGDSSVSIPLDETLPMEKNYSDLAYVLNGLTPNFKLIKLFGFSGGRLDHELINFGEVHEFLTTKNQTRVEFANSASGFSSGQWSVNIKGEFSLITVETSNVKITGKCKYHLSKLTAVRPMSSLGLSNLGFGQIDIESSYPFFLIFPLTTTYPKS